MESCIFEGRVRHARQHPVAHRFSYRIFLMYLDLAELPTLFDRYRLWSTTRPAIARFRREDHVGPSSVTLDEAVRRLVAERTGRRPEGPIRLLTHLSYFGYCFNPVSFYYCFDAAGDEIETVIAEVNNTPWGEQHCYVLPARDAVLENQALQFSASKAMHVSPFMHMNIAYEWRFTPPGLRLDVFMANSDHTGRFFDVRLALRRREITSASLLRVLLAYPFMTLRVMLAIHWQALKLWLKGCPVYVHPAKRPGSADSQ